MKIGRNAAYAGLVLGATIFFALRAFLSYGQGPGVYGATGADGVLCSFFAGVAYPVGGRVLVPLDWLLMVAGAQAACAAVMALGRGRWGAQVTLQIGSSVKAWLGICIVMMAIAAAWILCALTACFVAALGLSARIGEGAPEIIALELASLLALLLAQAVASLLAGPIVGFCVAFIYSTLAFIGPWAALPPSWMMLERSPWIWQGNAAALAATAASAVLSLLLILVGAFVSWRRDWLVITR